MLGSFVLGRVLLRWVGCFGRREGFALAWAVVMEGGSRSGVLGRPGDLGVLDIAWARIWASRSLNDLGGSNGTLGGGLS
jgi:hypothetical protein